MRQVERGTKKGGGNGKAKQTDSEEKAMPRIYELSDGEADARVQEKEGTSGAGESDAENEDAMPGLVDVPVSAGSARSGGGKGTTIADASDSDGSVLASDDDEGGSDGDGDEDDDDDDDADDSDSMRGVGDAPSNDRGHSHFHNASIVTDSEDSDDDSDSMPGLVDAPPQTTAFHKNAIDNEDDDNVPDLVDVMPASSRTTHRPPARPRYGDTSTKADAAPSCCNTIHLHVLDLCNSPLVHRLRSLIAHRKKLTDMNVVAHKTMMEAEAEVMRVSRLEHVSPEDVEEAGAISDKCWELISAYDTQLKETRQHIRLADEELVAAVKRVHGRLERSYGRKKNGKFYDGSEKLAKHPRGHAARKASGGDGRDQGARVGTQANMLGLSEIDKALRILTNVKRRNAYLTLGGDVEFAKTVRTPRYADKDDIDAQPVYVKKQEPVWSLMKRERAGGVQRYHNNPNRIQRVIVLEYPPQPTCPEVSVTDNESGRTVTLSWYVSQYEERKIEQCHVQMRANMGTWDIIWKGADTSCTVQIEDHGLLNFRVLAENELGTGVWSTQRGVTVGRWKPKGSAAATQARKTRGFDTVAPDVEVVLNDLKDKIADIVATNPSDLSVRVRVLSELQASLPAITKHHQHLPILFKYLGGVIQATEAAFVKSAKAITKAWSTKLNYMQSEILRTADVSFVTATTWSTASELSDMLEGYAGGSAMMDDAALTPQSKNQIWQAVSTLYGKRPLKLIPNVTNNTAAKKDAAFVVPVIVTPGLAVLRRIERVLQAYVEASEMGLLSGVAAVKEWHEVVSRQVERAIEREEVRADEIVKAERARIQMEEEAAAERARRERLRVESELRRRAAAEEKERILIEKRLQREEAERREATMRAEMERTRLQEVAAREMEEQRLRSIEESRNVRDEMMRRQMAGYQHPDEESYAPPQQVYQSNRYQSNGTYAPQTKVDAPSLRVVRVPRTKPSMDRVNAPTDSNEEGRFNNESNAESAPFSKSRAPCKFFATPRGCKYGDRCNQSHVMPSNGTDIPSVTASSVLRTAVVSTLAAEDPPLCKFFNTRSGCRYGDSCRSIHIADAPASRRIYVNGAPAPVNNGGDKVQELFRETKLPVKLQQAFKSNDFHAEDYACLTEEDLVGLGFASAHIRKQFLGAVRRLFADVIRAIEAGQPGPVPVRSASAWLKGMGVECQVVEMIAPQNLPLLDESMIRVPVEDNGLGITKIGQAVRLRKALLDLKVRGVRAA
ncbi:hypothetical protein BC830DRAFT_1089884 [Chytriomyces sp. MP71]|nr:hypothetical protein BC830DRAFT_1089884 [Chytriomyces sp. MP71]